MLTNLRIENFAIIDKLNIDFVKGFNVIIGQTGAGKTIIIQALNLLNGARSEFDKVKDESKKAVVEATFKLKESFINNHPYVKDYLEDDQLVISKILYPNNQKTQTRVNGEVVSLNVLKKIMANVLDIFSQGDANFLLDSENQLNLLDNYENDKKFIALKQEYLKAYKEYISNKERLEEFKTSIDLSSLDFLEYQVLEIEKFHLKENEIEDLNLKKDELSSYEEIVSKFKEFENRYNVNNSIPVTNFLDDLIPYLRNFEDTSLKDKAEKIIDNIDILEDSFKDIFNAYENLDFDENSLDNINSRLFELSDLQRKYGKSTSEILSKYQKMKEQIQNIKNYNSEVENLNNLVSSSYQKALEISNNLTAERKKIALKLEKDINLQLASLALKDNGFKIEFKEVPLNKNGSCQIEFLCLLNKGGKYLKLDKVLSGGENARLNLALKAVFNLQNENDTIIFDEIDTGISGEIAYKAGLKMVEISSTSQVICITHLVQVACLSDALYLVYKIDNDEKTSSYIKKLNQQATITNLAQMMGIASSSFESSALELYNNAQKDKKDIVNLDNEKHSSY